MLKKLLGKLLKKSESSEEPTGNFIVAQLNEKVWPIDRGLVYEDPLDEFLKQKYYGEVTGGGTAQEKTGELSFCDIEIELTSKIVDKSTIADIVAKLESLGAPNGSKLIIERTKEEIPFGKKEGLALYIDGVGLPDNVYKECDINFVLSELHRLTNIEPNADRNWQGEKVTALYFFSDSFELMKNSISNFISTYPLCKGARVVQIA
jgi:hypothetical protein